MRSRFELFNIILLEYKQQIKFGCNTGLCKVIGQLAHDNCITSMEYGDLSDWLTSVRKRMGKSSTEYFFPREDTQARIDLLREYINAEIPKYMALTQKQPVKAPQRVLELITSEGEILPMANQIAQGTRTTLNCTLDDSMLKLANDNSIEREVDVENDEIMLTFIFKDKSELVLCITR